MQMGMIGLGRMGANMVRRLLRGGHECVVFDVSADAVKGLVKEGAIGASSLDDFRAKLKKPRVAWMMVPAAVVEKTLADWFISSARREVSNQARDHIAFDMMLAADDADPFPYGAQITVWRAVAR